MKKLSKKQKLISFISVLLITVILAIAITTNIINKINIARKGYSSTTANANSNLVARYIKSGITIGGITGTLETLDTSDATAIPADIAEGKTAYVDGKKITGTRLETVREHKSKGDYFEKDQRLTDDVYNIVKIPEGFKIAEDSATAVEEGIVIEDKNKNQYVWIPAKTNEGAEVKLKNGNTIHIIYNRTNYGIFETDIEFIDREYSHYVEELPTEVENSINNNGGYYIGRFETGDKESTEYREETSPEGKPTIQKGSIPYNWVTVDEAEKLSIQLGKEEEYKTTETKLISSYAWDTTLDFMQKVNSDNEIKNYSVSSPQGSYLDTEFSYLNINGQEEYKDLLDEKVIPTGQTTPVCNIYDMGGNLHEITTEKMTTSTNHVNRGGGYLYYSDERPAGCRGNYNNYNIDIGFRILMLFKN